ncbi:hypothetical protein ACE10Z_39260 [Bradyrhizobium sp. Pha-3]|uniref:hypothetical protein n=1 Tax=Bradyrhizobium sp. Pha-3 TaxID=208375 RepID=UPI0035D4AB65
MLIRWLVNPDFGGSWASGVLVAMGPKNWGTKSEEWVFHLQFAMDDEGALDLNTLVHGGKFVLIAGEDGQPWIDAARKQADKLGMISWRFALASSRVTTSLRAVPGPSSESSGRKGRCSWGRIVILRSDPLAASINWRKRWRRRFSRFYN